MYAFYASPLNFTCISGRLLFSYCLHLADVMLYLQHECCCLKGSVGLGKVETKTLKKNTIYKKEHFQKNERKKERKAKKGRENIRKK